MTRSQTCGSIPHIRLLGERGMTEGAGGQEVSILDREIEIINNTENAPSIQIDGAQGLIAFQGVVRINLYQIIQEFDRTPDRPASYRKLIVARLSMTPQVAQSITSWLAGRVAGTAETSSPTEPRKSSDGE
jgi:hypothetical protein